MGFGGAAVAVFNSTVGCREAVAGSLTGAAAATEWFVEMAGFALLVGLASHFSNPCDSSWSWPPLDPTSARCISCAALLSRWTSCVISVSCTKARPTYPVVNVRVRY